MDLEKANKAINTACWAGIISGSFTAIVSVIAGFGYSFAGFTVWNLFDALLIFGMAYGIYRKSRVCAVIMFVYWVASKIISFTEKGHLGGIFIAIIFAYAFFQGVRGTFAYHRMNLKKIKEKLCYWANKNADIRTVYLYGSRVTGDFNKSSDLDVAVELDPQQGHIDSYAFWVSHGMELEQELQSLLTGYNLHLEYYDKNKPEMVKDIVRNGIEKSSVVVYSRENDKKAKDN